MKSEFATHRFNTVSSSLSSFATQLPQAVADLKEVNPLYNSRSTVEIELGDAHKQEILKSDGFKLVVAFCKVNNYGLSVRGYDRKVICHEEGFPTISITNSAVSVSIKEPYDNRTRLEKWIFGEKFK